MAKVILKQGLLELVPAQMKHVIPLYQNLSKENLFELQIADLDPIAFFINSVRKDYVYVVEKKGKPLAITGIEHDDNQSAVMWAMFTNDIKENWVGFLRSSPKLIEFFHLYYYKLNMNILAENEQIIEWAMWLKFVPEYSFIENNIEYIHFVRCNQDKKNVYTLSSRPVIH